MKFAKLHGAGNDFIILTKEAILDRDPSELAKVMCHRKFGIGADGLMVSEESDIADICMKYYNSDGTLAEMCGNGIRCFSRFAYELGLVNKMNFTVETLAGILEVQVMPQEERTTVMVTMGKADILAKNIPAIIDQDKVWGYKATIDGQTYELYSVRLGVPHTVIFTDCIDVQVTETIGPQLERLSIFPERTNINFVEIVNPNVLKVDTWERGAGHTLACGTGVCASVWIAHERGLCGASVKVETLGGTLYITIDKGVVYMEGEAHWICRGDFFEE